MQEYKPAMKALMLAIGARMSDRPELWIQNTYISRWSTLWDFFGDNEVAIKAISDALGIELPESMNLGEIADRMNLQPEFRETCQ